MLFRFIAIVIILLSQPSFSIASPQIHLTTDTGQQRSIDVEVADNFTTRSLGLMYRRSLPEKSGLLLLFPFSESVAIWMKNTYIPLDIIFLSEAGRVQKIIKNAKTDSSQVYLGEYDSIAVLELNAGDADAFGISIHSHIQFSHLLNPS